MACLKKNRINSEIKIGDCKNQSFLLVLIIKNVCLNLAHLNKHANFMLFYDSSNLVGEKYLI